MQSNKILIFLTFVIMFNGIIYTQELPYINKTKGLENMLEAKVLRVIDGDTVEVKINATYDGINKKEVVRLLGVDTPETKHPTKKVEYYGEEAFLYTKKHLNKKVVYLLFDNSTRDRYGRLLCYIYTKDGNLFNLRLIFNGYAYAYTKYKIYYDKEFINAQKDAKLNKRGLWK